jgi:2-oxoglutarate dehydrogenase E2 component (dihydrolipoamide succinyltransferase)
MHNIIERPIAVSGKVEIHPMMYVAPFTTIGLLMVRNLLVFFAIKEALESPMELLLDNDPKKAFDL